MIVSFLSISTTYNLISYLVNSLIIYLASFYIIVGSIFLLVPLIYLELGRSRDLIIAFLNLLIGFVLIIKNKTIDESFFLIFLLFTIIVFIYLVELFSYKHNQNMSSKRWVRNDKNDNIKN